MQEAVVVRFIRLINRLAVVAAVVVSDCWQDDGVGEILGDKLVNGCDVVFHSSISLAGGVRSLSISSNLVGSMVTRNKKDVRLAELIEEACEHSFNNLGRGVTPVSAELCDRVANNC